MKGDIMRPLIEILEDERKLMQRLESVYRFMLRDDDPEILVILRAKKETLDRDLGLVRVELKEYIGELFKKES
jgi:hypothetical protein